MYSIVLSLFFATEILGFTPNCVPENQFRFYAFPVEGCSEYFPEKCKYEAQGRFQTLGDPSVVKIRETTVLPTCAFYNAGNLKAIWGVNGKIKVLARGSFTNLPNLESINLAFNQISEVRENVFKNVSVKILDLSWNNIVFIDPDAFKELANLRYLNLSRNSLLTVPVNSLSSSIVSLNLAFNLLTRIAINSNKFRNLTNVDLSNNAIEKVAISYSYPLEIMDLSSNRLTNLDYIDVQSVGKFKIGQNLFTNMPQYLENLNAKEIDIYPNPWKCEELFILWNTLITFNYRLAPTKPGSNTSEICANVAGRRIGTTIRSTNCIDDRDCASDMVCKTGKCWDPCQAPFCGKNSVCKVVNHEFTCSCPNGLRTNPLDLSGSCNNVECYTNYHCPNHQTCISEVCVTAIATTNLIPSTTPSYSYEVLPYKPPAVPVPWWYEDIPSVAPPLPPLPPPNNTLKFI